MDSHGEYSPLERSRLLRASLDAGGSSGSIGINGAGNCGSLATSVSEVIGRAATPTTLSLAQYHSRFGLPPSAVPGSNLAVMSSLFGGAHGSDARKALLIDFQQYWNAHADSFPRYLMTGALYPPYPPLLPGTAESLSLLGAGVACMAGGASNGAGPSQSQHVAHYQRLLEMQKEAYLASLSAAATHHTALYGLNATALPPFLDNTPCSPHGVAPFSLVKQEPRELSYPEKTHKQTDRRAGGFKMDMDLNRGSKETQTSLSTSLGNSHNTQTKELKLSPSMANGSSTKLVKRGNGSSASSSSNSHQNAHKSSAHIPTNSPTSVRHSSDTARSKCISPSSKQTSQSVALSMNIIHSSSKRSVSKSSPSARKHVKSTSLGHTSSTSSNASLLSSSAVLRPESAVVSVPTHVSAPIPLATVQHDGVVLSALASPSSAAASLASNKPAVLKQQMDKLNRASSRDKEHVGNGKSVSEANTSSGLSVTPMSFEHNASDSQLSGDENRALISSINNTNDTADSDQNDSAKVLCDDGSDIIVDSTEKDYPDTARSPDKSDHDRAIEETIEKVASGGDYFTESDPEAVASPQYVKPSTDATMTPTLLSVTRTGGSFVVTSSGSSSSTRTIYAKTQPVPSVTVSGCVQLSSSITTLASTSALPYYHTLYSKPQGAKRVHATTFVPEVGVFKGPSIKTVRKASSSPSPSGTMALSPETRSRLDPRLVLNIQSLPADGHFRVRDSTPSPSLWSPSRDLVSHSTYSLSASPGIAHTTTESLDSTSLDSASVRSQSVASFRSVPEVDCLDDTSDEIESDAAIDHTTYNNCQQIDNSQPASHTDCTPEAADSDDDDNEEEDDDDETLPKENDSVLDEEDYFSVTTTPVNSGKEFMHINNGNKEELCDSPITGSSSAKSSVSLNSRVGLVPSELSDKLSCDTAIDYSLPKLSGSDISSHPHASCSVNYSLLASSTEVISSATRSQTRYESAGLSGEHFLLTPSLSHKRRKRNPDYFKLQVNTATPQDIVSKVRRLKQHEDGGIKRCGSAPPIASRPFGRIFKGGVLAAPSVSGEKEFLAQDKSDSCTEHSAGNNIPVGIAVAHIRPHHIHQPKESQTSGNLSRDVRHAHSSDHSKNSTQETTSMAPLAAAVAPSLMVTGHTVNPSPWLPQVPFHIHPAMNSSGATFDPSFPITAPRGYKFAHDSLTGQFFIVPTGEFAEQGGVWPAASFPPAAGACSAHFQTNISVPAITISGPETKGGRAKPERINTGRCVVSGNTLDSLVSDQDIISKDTTEIARGYCPVVAHPNPDDSSTSTLKSVTGNATTAPVTSVTSLTSVSQPVVLKVEPPMLEDRGCSPVVFEDVSTPLTLLSQHQTCKNVTSCTVETQTCNEFMKSTFIKNSSPPKLILQDQAIQASFSDISTLNPLSVQCPDLDSVDVLTQPREVKTNSERASYNPFTDPQILQAADGLELLSTLAEKRTKCSSFDDPKRIFPSPSDSFKSDCASIVATEETLSPEDTELRSGQCTPRREVRRDLSPKWSIPKKDPQTSSIFADFKTPTDIEIPEESEMRVKLAEVRRQYKEKQKELAKLRSKKSEEIKPSKRGPGRPPKKKLHNKRSDDESSSSSSKTKDHHQPLKKKRPAEELVDRVFRKLPPVIKSSKVSRSIHYVKSKTGPFFRRKSASSSVKRNKDLFGFDESTWPSFSERKHQEKIKATGSFSGKSKCRHRSSLGHGSGSKHDHDTGNIFTNLESFSGDYIKRREKAFKHQSHKQKKHLYRSGHTAIKSETCSLTCHQESGLGLLVKFALTVSTTSQPSSSVSLSLSSLTAASSSSATIRDSQSSIGCFNSGVFSTNISNSTNYCSSLYNMSGNTGNGSQTPGITFGSLSSLMSSPSSGPISFTSPILREGSHNSSIPATKSISTFAATATAPSPSSVIASPATSMYMTSPLFPSPGAHHSSTEESNSGLSMGTSSNASGCISSSTSGSTTTSGSTGTGRDISPFKKKHDDDSDTDASDTSPNKKRKPGRPRKINPEKSSVGTETIWAKKSNTIGLHQEPGCSLTNDGNKKQDCNNGSHEEEWMLRRSERIFLSESSPLPSPSLSPSPRGEPVWKLSHFMPKCKKVVDINKSIKENIKDMTKPVFSKDQTSLSSSKISAVSSPTLSSSLAVKAEEKDFVSSASTVSWTAPHKAEELSISKADDAKLVFKLEDSMKSSSLLSPTSSGKSRKTYEDLTHNKQKSKKKMKKLEMIPSKSTLLPSPTAFEKKVRRAEEHSKIKLQKARSLHDITQRVKKKFCKPCIKKRTDDQDSKSGKKKRKIDSSDSVNLASVSSRENPLTSEPHSCKLQQSDLREGLKVLYLIDGLFHEGTVKALQPPDVYGVLTAGQRGNRPHILCLEEILKWAVLDMKPESVRSLPEGTRVCAFWSQQFSCLYPGTVAKSKPMYNGNKVVIPVEFDDGDNGKIELDHIRILPPEFPIVEYEPDPLEVLPKRKQRLSDATDVRKSVETESASKQFGSDEDNEDGRESKTDADSDDLGVMITYEAWKWDGKGIKKIGPKGKSKKVFYKAVTRGNETIGVGDSAVFVSKDGSQCPYIGRIESLWESFNGQRMVKVYWYYHPEETLSTRKLSEPKNALFESQHEDENDIQTIAYKCEVLPYVLFKKRASDAAKKGEPLSANVFYLAGFYDPSAKNITFYQGVS